MGLSVAISGGIILTVFVLILFSLPGLADKMFSIGDITTQVAQHEQEISKTEISIDNLSVLVGSSRVNFTLNNDGSEKLWNFEDFDLFIEYDGAISGKRTEQLSYSGECPGTVPPAGNWCIDSISNDVTDPKILNSDEKAYIRTTLSENLASSTTIVTVATDNGVTFKTGGSPTNEGIPKPTHVSPKKWGEIIPVSITQNLLGLLNTATLQGSEVFVYNVTERTSEIRSTTAVSAFNDNAGVTLNNTAGVTNGFRGDLNSYAIARQWTGHINANRLFFGFESLQAMTPAGSDNILTGRTGAGICINTTSTIYQLCTNSGGATSYESLGVTEDGKRHTFEVYAKSDGVQWCARIDGGNELCTSNNIPAATTKLYFMDTIESSNNVQKNIGYSFIYVEKDR
jgi:hypothetical protein